MIQQQYVGAKQPKLRGPGAWEELREVWEIREGAVAPSPPISSYYSLGVWNGTQGCVHASALSLSHAPQALPVAESRQVLLPYWALPQSLSSGASALPLNHTPFTF